ncbi:hypothetical protein TorRG33x02_297200 [Trema orientale]|uniref:Uncharacterized protein n=1 Tax=Trema orientale TaxID=63057 RepID=A0A2P5C540_TREOI|nr:hypothetical protein TorRG33x02_297200 [Trema orientale]
MAWVRLMSHHCFMKCRTTLRDVADSNQNVGSTMHVACPGNYFLLKIPWSQREISRPPQNRVKRLCCLFLCQWAGAPSCHDNIFPQSTDEYCF